MHHWAWARFDERQPWASGRPGGVNGKKINESRVFAIFDDGPGGVELRKE
jgi:hypothetical protein